MEGKRGEIWGQRRIEKEEEANATVSLKRYLVGSLVRIKRIGLDL
jgi:hypothetical protein